MLEEETYLLVESGKETGPFTTPQLHERIEANEIFPETVCIPMSLRGIRGPLAKFIPGGLSAFVTPALSFESEDVSKESTTRGKWALSGLDYVRISICALPLLGGTGIGVLVAIVFASIFFGKRVYQAYTGTTPEATAVNKPNAGREWARRVQREMAASRDFAEKKKHYIESIKSRSICDPVEITVLGGAGWESRKDSKCILSLDTASIYISDLKSLIDTTINIEDLREIEVSGPGKVTNNAGVMGGGFGAEGALKGMAIATVINILTTYSNTKTFIRLGFQSSEIVMLTSQLEPDKARILLSPLFLTVSRKTTGTKSTSVSGEIEKLYDLKRSGAIADAEFEKLKNQLIG